MDYPKSAGPPNFYSSNDHHSKWGFASKLRTENYERLNCCRLGSKSTLQYIDEATARRRSRSNRKERRRNEEMNAAYSKLQKCVPHIPNDQKLPKIKTLRLALRYIKHLQSVLEGNQTFRPSFSNEPRPLALEDFASVAMAEMQARNNYKDRAEQEVRDGIRTEDICRESTNYRPPSCSSSNQNTRMYGSTCHGTHPLMKENPDDCHLPPIYLSPTELSPDHYSVYSSPKLICTKQPLTQYL
ncbi:hypothetical protein AB6A40_010175 [Gnathostoma spinigerum]|uniref:BHLH domain-containing protein n=1 Tax=Gnathostoma spinigerum TaxID=75299 RepID=A0ABD6EUD6_9BILA